LSRRLAGFLLIAGFFAWPCHAASIPAWLDDAINNWNAKNQATPIEFVDVKDSFVWYRLQKTEQLGHKELRDVTFKIVTEHGYVPAESEESITAGKPPASDGTNRSKKCYSRSYMLDLDREGSGPAQGGDAALGKRQRLLTTLICEDGPFWDAGFRVVQ